MYNHIIPFYPYIYNIYPYYHNIYPYYPVISILSPSCVPLSLHGPLLSVKGSAGSSVAVRAARGLGHGLARQVQRRFPGGNAGGTEAKWMVLPTGRGICREI